MFRANSSQMNTLKKSVEDALEVKWLLGYPKA